MSLAQLLLEPAASDSASSTPLVINSIAAAVSGICAVIAVVQARAAMRDASSARKLKRRSEYYSRYVVSPVSKHASDARQKMLSAVDTWSGDPESMGRQNHRQVQESVRKLASDLQLRVLGVQDVVRLATETWNDDELHHKLMASCHELMDKLMPAVERLLGSDTTKAIFGHIRKWEAGMNRHIIDHDPSA